MQCYIRDTTTEPTKTVTCDADSRRGLYDAAGIFCCYVCDNCERAKRKIYRPEIFDDESTYAKTGDESDIGADYPDWIAARKF